ncbi:hypothetical protein D7B24_006680 [Verticillium nonalfalfae]|uniref:Alpha/beta hydrolase fold-3 domain-containing protein n=1 Tax=Verticillium nonalfalfae TaxID=1051616 RepID=A0A3M9YKY7_9PEZI|nr:uncharacterized protein D7B24_006680 [Verticillium nonalfalfae]RNJ60612.1 hypothetical protein D7B24_006680 [Verticillium nonalfalfae]
MTSDSSPPDSVELTPWEVRTMPWRRRLIYIRAVFTFLSGVVRSKLSPEAQNLHWRQRLALAALQSKSALLTSRQRTFGSSGTSAGDLIREYCHAKGLSLRSVAVSDAGTQPFAAPPAVLHFITPAGAPATGLTIFYAYGGGYAAPIAVVGHIPMALRAAKTISARQVVFIEYSLTPRHPYPSQLVQAASGLQTLLDAEGVKASEVVAMGDSAGGHLIASLLAHIAVPSPYALPVNLHGDQLAAAVIISPWIAMTTDQASFDTNEATDFLDRPAALLFKCGFAPNVDEPWANLIDAPDSAQVWNSVFRPTTGKPVVRKAIVLTGTAEVLMDSNVAFGKVHLRGADLVVDRNTDVPAQFPDADYVFVAAVEEAHTQTILDAAVGYDEGNMSRAIREFLKRL